MAADTARIAQDLAQWLQTRPRASEVRVSLHPVGVQGPRSRFPRPPFRRAVEPTFEISLVYKEEPRLLRYFIEHDDDRASMNNTLRVHTNGELMVRVPNEYGQLLPNDIYYRNRSRFAPGLGDPAPNPMSRG